MIWSDGPHVQVGYNHAYFSVFPTYSSLWYMWFGWPGLVHEWFLVYFRTNLLHKLPWNTPKTLETLSYRKRKWEMKGDYILIKKNTTYYYHEKKKINWVIEKENMKNQYCFDKHSPNVLYPLVATCNKHLDSMLLFNHKCYLDN
jgi:hypothetical protein